MSLPVVNIEVDYQIEKDKIKDFLSNFVGPASGDNVADGIADMDIGDYDGNPGDSNNERLEVYVSASYASIHEFLSDSVLTKHSNASRIVINKWLVIDLEDIA
ncbi:hypothetical protein EDB85DRAFT_2148443 [Lactarius pseudohatsudake]|nr:hypothetical protein EDB85DRAFT_2148443 [Lactarius pseudohatsudake]